MIKRYAILLSCVFFVGCAMVIDVGPRGTRRVTPLPQVAVGLPSLQEAVFVDAEPFDWPDLRGKIVLVAVLDFTKKDEQEILSVLNLWRDHANLLYGNFEIIGVHVPSDNIFYSLTDLRKVMQEYALEDEIKVIIDPEQLLWSGFGRFEKPFLVLVDEYGNLHRIYHSLVDYMQVITDLAEMGIHLTDMELENKIPAGFEKGKIGNASDIFGFAAHEYKDTGAEYLPGIVYLEGVWSNRPKSYYYSQDDKGGYVAFRFFSSGVSIIAQSGKIRITLDEHDLPIQAPYIGEDIKDAEYNTFCEVTKKRVYNLLKDIPPAVAGHIMKIYPQETGFEIFEIRDMAEKLDDAK